VILIPLFLTAEVAKVDQFSDSYLLQLLRRALNKCDAEFTCPQQRDLIRHVLTHERNLVAVLPTGSGKSMAWLIPSIIPSEKTSVVIVPHQSLLHDHIKEARERQISFHHWTANNRGVELAKIIFIAMESVTSKAFQE
jgi:superfamily II DNA helicase RecQ